MYMILCGMSVSFYCEIKAFWLVIRIFQDVMSFVGKCLPLQNIPIRKVTFVTLYSSSLCSQPQRSYEKATSLVYARYTWFWHTNSTAVEIESSMRKQFSNSHAFTHTQIGKITQNIHTLSEYIRTNFPSKKDKLLWFVWLRETYIWWCFDLENCMRFPPNQM